MKRIMQHASPTVPKLLARVPAGSPLDLATELEYVDLNELLADEYCILLQVSGSSMETAIYENDYVIVKRNRIPTQGDIVIASVSGEYTAKLYRPYHHGLRLVAINKGYDAIDVREDFYLIGVVVWILKRTVPMAA